MPSSACDQCHRRKQPCAGGKPACESCIRLGNICTYSTGKPVGKPKGHKKSMSHASSSTVRSDGTSHSPQRSRVQLQRPSGVTYVTAVSVSSPSDDSLSASLMMPQSSNDILPPTTHWTWDTTAPVEATLGQLESMSFWSACITTSHELSSHPTGPPAGDYRWCLPAESLAWQLNADSDSSSAAATGTSATPSLFLGDQFTTNNSPQSSALLGTAPHSMAADLPVSRMVNGLSLSPQSSPSCSCSTLSDDIGRLFQLQLNSTVENVPFILEAAHGIVKDVDKGLGCSNCTTQWPPRLRTMSHIIALEHVQACYKSLLWPLNNEGSTATKGTFFSEGGQTTYALGTDRHYLCSLIQTELFEVERVAMIVDQVAQGPLEDGNYQEDLRSLVVNIFEALEVLRTIIGAG